MGVKEKEAFQERPHHHNRSNVDWKINRWAIKEFPIKTMIDVGCGQGGQVEYARSLGVDAVGVDGDPRLDIYDKPYFVLHDYTKGPYVPDRIIDLGWSMEFLEHVYEKYMNNYMATFQRCRVVMCTHALVGQQGTHHVNCQDDDYWIDAFSKRGFSYDPRRTERIRRICDSVWTCRGGLFFVNTNMLFENG
jgi:cyclopropane fatty-acyl-phospholipid synthase-like methyltransferase